MGTDAQFHTQDRGRETVDGRTVPVRTRGLNVHATFHLVTMCHGPLLDGHPCTQARRSQTQGTCELAGSPTSSLGASAPAHWFAGRELVCSQTASSQGASSPSRELILLVGRELAGVRARAGPKQDLVAGATPSQGDWSIEVTCRMIESAQQENTTDPLTKAIVAKSLILNIWIRWV
ncbi:UNVERIFIED_CONTAM: hypothetical protein Sradi_7102400 [Sesamum radiatum]|uniref:Uncharacterized protein n=1 Tax=Sesamum radiatum TaxID=300843 RepID=A0AAW2J188_SESRA